MRLGPPWSTPGFLHSAGNLRGHIKGRVVLLLGGAPGTVWQCGGVSAGWLPISPPMLPAMLLLHNSGRSLAEETPAQDPPEPSSLTWPLSAA